MNLSQRRSQEYLQINHTIYSKQRNKSTSSLISPFFIDLYRTNHFSRLYFNFQHTYQIKCHHASITSNTNQILYRYFSLTPFTIESNRLSPHPQDSYLQQSPLLFSFQLQLIISEKYFSMKVHT